MARVKTYPDDLRDRLVEAAFERLRHEEPEEVSLRDLAAECHTSTNAIYSIFGGKDALISEVARVAREDFLRPQFELAGREPSLEVFAASGGLYRSWAKANPGLYRLIFGGVPGARDFAPRAHMVEPIRLLLERLQERGLVRPHDSDEVSMSLWACTHGFVMLEMSVWPPDMAGVDSLYESHLANCVGRIVKPVGTAD